MFVFVSGLFSLLLSYQIYIEEREREREREREIFKQETGVRENINWKH